MTETDLLYTVDAMAAALAHYEATGQRDTPRWQWAAARLQEAARQLDALTMPLRVSA